MHGVILLAAGSGARMGEEIRDKILEPIGSSNAFKMSLEAFVHVMEIQIIVIAFRDEQQRKELQTIVDRMERLKDGKIVIFVKGGMERGDSVRNGLNSFPKSCKFVHIHDCARPMIRKQTVETLVRTVSKKQPIALARQATNTIRRKLTKGELSETETLSRNELWIMETPQSAPISWFIEGYAKAKEMGIAITDDMHAIELISKKMNLMNPGYPNPKITHQHDLNLISSLLNHE